MTHRRPRLSALLGSGVVAAVLVLLSPRLAGATPDFPQVLDSDLSLTAKIETTFPPDGCLLCHTTEVGGKQSLKAFGTLAHQYGASSYNPNSLKAALTAVQGANPKLIDDLKAGKDPNQDSSAGSTLPSPGYGCSATGGGAEGACFEWIFALAAAGALARRRQKVA